jgi:uncharacterized membrane protein YozB (DUF420 family)
MIVHIVKFIHLLATLGLLGTTAYCFILQVSSRRSAAAKDRCLTLLPRLNKSLLHLALVALLTGTLLVYPKHFTFQTAWIQAAYLLVGCFCIVALWLTYFKNKKNTFFLSLIYFSLLSILVAVIHDAVTKTTFLF